MLFELLNCAGFMTDFALGFPLDRRPLSTLFKMRESSFIEDLQNTSLKKEHSMSKKCKLYLMFSAPWESRECKMFSKQMRGDFDPIFKIASMIGISIASDSDIEEDNPKINKNVFKKFYDILINLFALLSLVVAVLFASNYTSSRAMTLTYGVKYIASFMIRCYMIKGDSKIPRVIKTLSKLYENVPASFHRSLKVNIYLQCLAFSLLNLAMIILTCVTGFTEMKVQDVSYLTLFGHNFTADSNFNTIHLLVVSYIANYSFCYFTMTISILSCCNVHVIIRRLIKFYGDALVLSIKEKGTKESFAEDFSLFRKIIYGLNEADDAMSFIVFFTYVSCISCFLNTLSAFFDVDDISQQPLHSAGIFFTFLYSVAIFLTITCSAAEVSTAGDRLKQRILCVSDHVLHRNLPNDTMLSFMLTIDNIKSSSMSMTGWGMFTITRGFVLTTVGVIITYGVLLFQFAS